DDTLHRRETLELVRAYYRITDPAMRKRVSDLIKAMTPPEYAARRAGAQPVAALFGQQQLRRLRLRLDLAPQPVDMRLQRVRRHRAGIAPDLTQQFRARHRPPARAVQVEQNGRLLLGQADPPAAEGEHEFRCRMEGV